MAVDNTGKDPFSGRIYVSGDLTGPGLGLCYSTDAGEEWEGPYLLDSAPGHLKPSGVTATPCAAGGVPAVGPDGELYVTWWSIIGAAMGEDAQIIVRKSTDGGVSFADPTIADDIKMVLQIVDCQPSLCPLSLPTIAVDQVTGCVYVAYTEYVNDLRYDVNYVYSTDGGSSWSEPDRATQFYERTQCFPWLCADPSGKVYLVYYNEDQYGNFDVYLAESDGGGAGFSTPNVKLNGQSSDPDNRNNRLDYINVASSGGYIHPLWTDFRDATKEGGDIYSAIVGSGCALQKGDVNLDCAINVLDVVLTVNIILGLYDPTPDQFWAADCNDDGEVDVLDVVCIVNIILGGGKIIAWDDNVKPAEVWFGHQDEMAMAKGSRCILPIHISSEVPIAGVQMVFKLGPNVLVPSDLQTSSFTKDMKLRYSIKSDKLILVMYGEHGETFGPGTGTAIEIVFDIDDITNIPQDPNFGLEFGDILLANTNAGIIPLKPRVEVEQEAALPETYSLSQNYPNPFNPETEISFRIPSAIHTSLNIFNILGQEVITLVDEQREAGHYTVTWSGRDEFGTEVTTGVYFYTLKAGEFTETKRMLLLK